MRKLKTTDVFDALRLIKKANIKEEIKPYIVKASKGELDIANVGIEGMLGFIEILTEKKSEYAIYEFLAGPLELDAKAVANMDLDLFADSLEAIGKENNLKRFFTLFVGLIGKKS